MKKALTLSVLSIIIIIGMVIMIAKPNPNFTLTPITFIAFDFGDFKEFYGDTDDGYADIQLENERISVFVARGNELYEYYLDSKINTQFISHGSTITIVGDTNVINLTVDNVTYKFNFKTMEVKTTTK